MNHSNSIVRSIISLLLDTIGLHIPHAICYQAIVIAEQLGFLNNFSKFSKKILDDFDIFMNIKRKQSTIKTLDNKDCNEEVNSNVDTKEATEELLDNQVIMGNFYFNYT